MTSNQLIYADSESNADLRYLTGFLAPDPFTYLKLGGKTYLLLSDLEVDRGKKQAKVDKVLGISDLQKECLRAAAPLLAGKKSTPSLADIVAYLCRQKKVSKLEVPSTFPLGLAMALQKHELSLVPMPSPFAQKRLLKNSQEIAAIAAVQRSNEKAMQAAYELLRESDVAGKKQQLFIGSQPLTSELIRQRIEEVLLKENCLALNTIVACGSACADPHDRGAGAIYAGQSIIVDIFPSSKETGYFADMTRTFCKGKAPERLLKIYDAVKKAQNLATKAIRPNVSVTVPDQKIRTHFDKLGFKTKKVAGKWTGFFHGTGHAVGLEIHELPSLSPRGQGVLKAGMVVTIEPGLYYPWGGVRLEDLVLVTKTGFLNLTNFAKMLEL